ncbi:MAG: hypothetical protein Faunusvirus14_14 [Faunusvirus sp.]|uniref:Uncharacterized protein n=1 Tax=Faunusvirus sp. TaxID=2487766 RepID=A0A3G4ZX15_9VIRU|nr:MAG: hypothetical protein Faunusvirus14_14 [Faunusvirus sp.]
MADHNITVVTPINTSTESDAERTDEKLQEQLDEYYCNKFKSRCLIVSTVIIAALVIANCVVLVETHYVMNNSHNVNTTVIYTDAVTAWQLVIVGTIFEITDIVALYMISRIILNDINENLRIISFMVTGKYFVLMIAMNVAIMSTSSIQFIPALYNVFSINQAYSYTGFICSLFCAFKIHTTAIKL